MASDTSLLQHGREGSLTCSILVRICVCSAHKLRRYGCVTHSTRCPFHIIGASSSHTKHQKIWRSDQHNIHPREVFCFPNGYKNSYQIYVPSLENNLSYIQENSVQEVNFKRPYVTGVSKWILFSSTHNRPTKCPRKNNDN